MKLPSQLCYMGNPVTRAEMDEISARYREMRQMTARNPKSSRKGMCKRCVLSVPSTVNTSHLYCQKYRKLCRSVARNCPGPEI